MTIEKLSFYDLEKLKALIRLYEDVFEMKDFVMPGESYLQSLLERKGTTFLIALVENKVVGGLTAHDLPSTYFEANEVYVYDLAVARDFQRQGIGGRLLSELSTLCRQKGDPGFFLQADLPDAHAIEFYRKAGGAEERVLHFDFDATKARPNS